MSRKKHKKVVNLSSAAQPVVTYGGREYTIGGYSAYMHSILDRRNFITGGPCKHLRLYIKIPDNVVRNLYLRDFLWRYDTGRVNIRPDYKHVLYEGICKLFGVKRLPWLLSSFTVSKHSPEYNKNMVMRNYGSYISIDVIGGIDSAVRQFMGADAKISDFQLAEFLIRSSKEEAKVLNYLGELIVQYTRSLDVR